MTPRDFGPSFCNLPPARVYAGRKAPTPEEPNP